MIRVLLMIAVAGFFLSLVTLSTAVAIGGPDAVARGAWASGDWWDWDWDVDHHVDVSTGDDGPEATRELAWTGGDTLELDVLADVTYRQAEGPAKLTVTGRKRAVDLLRIDNDGRVYLDGHRSRTRLNIVMTAPNLSTFRLNGSDRLVLENYSQDELNLDLDGAAEVAAEGQVQRLELEISGSGEADLSDLKAREASVDISGSGEAKIAPTEAADVNISGSGEVILLTNPARLTSDVSGSGTVRREGD
ncbi:GIN domain-containing protein [Phenylobacterium sp.]|uniref:GIN domain-containing protein n=1 Tax=Phenylobacterium sp. TaxID=1871053 RepID=UPI002BB1DEE7|nr:DUF2807 domain-containing protein [Phenylobacterium sp.]HVI32930.1 DUF2807 domain-containing protein [Phenylobacterium sp.]